MLKHVVSFYKTLFGKEDDEGVSLNEDFWEESEKVYEDKNELLEAPFSKAEVRRPSLAHILKGP
jgi:hypothetical protein